MSLYRPITIGSRTLNGNLFLAPVAGYTDRAFRTICIEMGADFTFTELISAEALTRNPHLYGLADNGVVPLATVPSATARALISRSKGGEPYSIQLFGGDSVVLERACALLAPLKPESIDLNAGCPVPKVTKTGSGSALMRDPVRFGRAITALVRASTQHLGGVPITVKIRSGWDHASLNFLECGRIAVDAGAAMVTLHARTRTQGYSGHANWNHIAELAAKLPVPVTASGDLYTPEDAQKMLRETACAAVMFARGAMGNPFIFNMTKAFLTGQSYQPPTQAQRFETALRHLTLLAEDVGERGACLEMRKQFCAYTKGLSGGAAMREQLVRAQTIADYRSILYTNVEAEPLLYV